MSFSIKLQKNTSPPNYVTKAITDIKTCTGTLREGTSIIDPVILLEGDIASNMVGAINYCYIADFGRNYYITNILSDVTGIWEIHCHVDVLMSFATQIRAQNAIVSRQERRFNMMLDDGWFMAYQDPIIQTKWLSEASPFEHQEFVLVVAGN